MNSLELFYLVKRWRWPLIVVGLVALFASTIFSGPAFIVPKYKSFAVVYPGNLIAYSTESPTEQMLQLLESSYIRDEIARQFRLAERYDIDTTQEHWRSKMYRMYEDNVNINKTEYESVEISVLDKDPHVAASMVDSILLYLNLKARSLQRQKSEELVVIVRNQLLQKEAEMDSLENRLQELREKYGLLDYVQQTRELTRGYVAGLASGRGGNSMGEVKNLISNLQTKGGEFFELSEHLARVRNTYDDFKVSYENALKDVNKELTYSNVVTRPVPADKKTYPIRWLIVVLSVIGAELVAILLIMIFIDKDIVSQKRFRNFENKTAHVREA